MGPPTGSGKTSKSSMTMSTDTTGKRTHHPTLCEQARLKAALSKKAAKKADKKPKPDPKAAPAAAAATSPKVTA